MLLPLAHEEKIRQLEGVEDVAKMTWVAAYYRDQKNFFANFAIDHDKLEAVWDDYAVPHDQMHAFKTDRQGAVIGPELARRIHDGLGVDTLEALEVAAHDGTLERVPGVGPRRAAAIRAALAELLDRARLRRRQPPSPAASRR